MIRINIARSMQSECVQVLDAALTRPGRLSRRVIVPLPDEQGRAEIMAVHLRNTPMASLAAKVHPDTLHADKQAAYQSNTKARLADAYVKVYMR